MYLASFLRGGHRRPIAGGAVLAIAVLVGLLAGSGRAAVSAAGPDDGQPSAALIVYGDTVRGADGLAPEEMPLLACVLANRFPQGSTIVFRIRVIDPMTGADLAADDVESVALTLPDGTSKALRYGPHSRGENPDVFWSASYQVAEDYPTGAFEYQITAVDKQGRTGMLRPFNVAPSMVQIVPVGSR